jgi:hypothetical protein
VIIRQQQQQQGVVETCSTVQAATQAVVTQHQAPRMSMQHIQAIQRRAIQMQKMHEMELLLQAQDMYILQNDGS